MKRLFLLLLLLGIFGAASAQSKQDLKVLYVGGSSDSNSNAPEDIYIRTMSFKNLLSQYFTLVDTIGAVRYHQELSAEYDVTVFDATPPSVRKYSMAPGQDGAMIYYQARVIDETFSYPALFIGDCADRIGAGAGSKLDWYCLCLDAHAHTANTEHQIFKGPFEVNLTWEDRPTPEDAKHYTYYYDAPLPEQIPMWRVQTKGYMTDEGFRVGMVSRPWGFTDSPDCEMISSGVCAKVIDAVAIGRTSNLFLWGFAASPDYMTDEAKVVFANSVSYISGFKGRQIARKYNNRIATRKFIKEISYLITEEYYQMRKEMNKEFYDTYENAKLKAEAKAENGETLTAEEQMVLQFQRPKEMSYQEHFEKYANAELIKEFGYDAQKHIDFYAENADYIYGGKGSYVLSLDKDAKSLGIANNDVKLLDKAISMLEEAKSEEEVEMAKRILDRYTLCIFDTAQEWRAWFDKNRDKIFFTESGGWLFMVDTKSSIEPANNYFAKDIKRGAQAIELTEPTESEPVSIGATLVTLRNGCQEVILKFKMATTYHIYANVSSSDGYIATAVSLELPEGYQVESDVNMPTPQYYNNSGTTILEDEAVYTQRIVGVGDGEIVVKYNYQCCNSQGCRMPVEGEIRIPTTMKSIR
ncbi:MAG: hypothetical protein SNH73_05645 [Rikenellaceae bacterium]